MSLLDDMTIPSLFFAAEKYRALISKEGYFVGASVTDNDDG